MPNKRARVGLWMMVLLTLLLLSHTVYAASDAFKENIYQVKALKPVDSKLKVKVGNQSPDFRLPSVAGNKVTLKPFSGKEECRSLVCACRLDASLLGPMARL